MSDIPVSLSLILSVSLSPPGGFEHQPRTVNAKTRSRANGDDVSCELTLSTPSCIYNAVHLSQSPPPSPLPPLKETETSDGSTTVSLKSSQSFPSKSGGEPSTRVEASSCGSSTVLNSMGTSRDVDLAPEGLDILVAADVHVEKSDILVPNQTVGLECLDLLAAAAVHVLKNISPARSQVPNAEQFQARPGTWQEKMRSLKGTKAVRVLVKKLVPSDLSRTHARLLFTQDEEDKGMPKGKGPTAERGSKRLLEYLNDVDRAGTRANSGLPVRLLNGRGEEHPGNKLRFWGGANSYTIIGKWLDFVDINELEVGDVVEVYFFRLPVDQAAAPSPNAASSSAATTPSTVPGVGSAPAVQDGVALSERLAIVMCSRVSAEEEERRRQEDPEAKRARRRQGEDSMKVRRKRKRADGASQV